MKRTYPLSEHEHEINGVKGWMYTIHAPQKVRGNMVHRNQTWRSVSRPVKGYGAGGSMTVKIRFDDECKNGHQSFSITADIYTNESRRQGDIAAGGCMHEEIAKIFPELSPLIKWHLVSTDGPMHYIANTVYHAGERNFAAARSCAVWPEATDEQLSMEKDELTELLSARLPALIAEFRADMDRIGFLWEPEKEVKRG